MAVGKEIDAMGRRTGLIPAGSGIDGATLKLESLVKSLNEGCGLPTQLSCVWCIQTYPPQTEIVIVLDSDTSVLDLFAEEGEFIRFVSLHE